MNLEERLKKIRDAFDSVICGCSSCEGGYPLGVCRQDRAKGALEEALKGFVPVKTGFIVEGQCGEWADAQQWSVAVFTQRSEAEAFVEIAHDWLRERNLSADTPHEIRPTSYEGPPPPFDTDFSYDYTGTRYHLVERPFAPTATK